ncbi:hypothetical protein [Mobilicoccus caccae]|uniref:Uncharacterized protein n=1 Tax=Mobilicoccus caccae TaxID=1859295 RepID=A0ABQ6ILJ0_9MICO|nr:hypothetical protein [Mobilicoccus caccae]GMA38299.1 hypothetical protein GCM10025883_03440 [Mobilicoccus caccae]
MTSLAAESDAFARRISDAVSAFVGRTVPFKSTSSGSRFVVTDDTNGIVIPVGEVGTLALEVNYRCELDGAGRYLKVLSSKVAVYAGSRPKGDPLFRYEYVHDQGKGLPAGHVHVHAHRDQFTRVMTLAAVSGVSRRQAAPDAELEAARLSRIHFPTGGHRFRPTLEDVLQMIEEEFGVRPGTTTWPQVLRTNRIQWRRHQTGSAVRDCPSEAVRVLEELGYVVNPPATGPVQDREDRLAAF